MNSSLFEEIGALVQELELVEKSPKAACFAGEIARLKLEAHTIKTKVLQKEIRFGQRRRMLTYRENTEFAVSIQRLRNKILFFKAQLSAYKTWHTDSPVSDKRNYSSDSSVSPVRPAKRHAPGQLQPSPLAVERFTPKMSDQRDSGYSGFSGATYTESLSQPQVPTFSTSTYTTAYTGSSQPSFPTQPPCTCVGVNNYRKCLYCCHKIWSPAPSFYSYPSRPFT